MRSPHVRLVPTAILFLLFSYSPVQAQSFNIDFGNAFSAPPSSYGAAGPAGTWNTVGVLPSGYHQPLVGLNGAPTAATIYMIGGTGMLIADDPGTSGGDQALMDDMLTGMNNPVDVCIWVDGLAEGDYEVLTYAKTPNDPVETHRVRVDYGVPGPLYIGGAWPGAHQEGVTFAHHSVYVFDGEIALHSGEWGALIRSGMNGIQIVAPTETSVGGLPPAPPSFTTIAGVHPNPSSARQLIELRLGERPQGEVLEIADVAGRIVWRQPIGGRPAGASGIEWDGRDAHGRSVPPGVYVARICGAAAAPHKIVRLR